ncbi:MAG: hypothetical protein WD823_03200 [Sulfuricaulis sp.]|uniref:hypothetical protein n=1 Tax=Sulfuricaulis sp. TaxID=2003553 RepID=UPI0034A27041
MYKSKISIEKKLAQAKYVLKMINKYRGRIFTNGGKDPETGANTLVTHISSFLAHTRSIVQYAHKEAKESYNIEKYDQYVTGKKIFSFFRVLRNSDIHEYTIGAYSLIEATAYFAPATKNNKSRTSNPIVMYVDEVSNINTPGREQRNVRITHKLLKKVEINSEVLSRLESEGRNDLVASAKDRGYLYCVQEFAGIEDLHELCSLYVSEIEKFISYGVENGFIS